MSFDKESFFSKVALKREEIEIEGGSVWVRELTALEAAEFQARSTQAIDIDTKKFASGKLLVDLSVYVVTCGAQTADGEPLFAKADADRLRALGAPLLEKIADAILSLSGIGKRQKKADSPATESADSGTA